jgi:hypothetical protein
MNEKISKETFYTTIARLIKKWELIVSYYGSKTGRRTSKPMMSDFDHHKEQSAKCVSEAAS